jgi:hypothetical protein
MVMKMKVTCILTLIVLFLCACSRKEAPKRGNNDPLNQVRSAPSEPPRHFLHKTFKVATYVNFPFDVPARAFNPKLQGSFKAYPAGKSPDAADDSSNVDFLLLNAEEFDDFTHNRSGAVRYSIGAAHSQDVDYALPATLEDPVKYFIVFRNSAPKGPPRMVDADFTISF